jgi:formate dehydrogenase gamma subunit
MWQLPQWAFRSVSILRYATDYHDHLLAVQILPATLKLFLWSIALLAALHLTRRAAGAPALTEAAEPPGLGYVERYKAGARLYHWGGVFVLMAALAASGLALYTPGTMPSAPISWLRVHELSAGLFIIGILLHIGFSTFRGEPRSMWLERQDFKDLTRIIGYLVGRERESPHFGKYDVVQKLYHSALAVLVAVLIFSGSVLFLNAEVFMTMSHRWMAQQRVLHDASSFLIVGMVLMHAYLRLLKANWPTLVSMFTGKVSLEDFRRRYDYKRWSPHKSPDAQNPGFPHAADPAANVRVVERAHRAG